MAQEDKDTTKEQNEQTEQEVVEQTFFEANPNIKPYAIKTILQYVGAEDPAKAVKDKLAVMDMRRLEASIMHQQFEAITSGQLTPEMSIPWTNLLVDLRVSIIPEAIKAEEKALMAARAEYLAKATTSVAALIQEHLDAEFPLVRDNLQLGPQSTLQLHFTSKPSTDPDKAGPQVSASFAPVTSRKATRKGSKAGTGKRSRVYYVDNSEGDVVNAKAYVARHGSEEQQEQPNGAWTNVADGLAKANNDYRVTEGIENGCPIALAWQEEQNKS